MHVTIDGYGGDPVRLADADLVREVLDRYPERIQMTKISTPHVQRYVGDKPQDWGVSGFVLIAESHISVHTFPEHRHVWIDVFSCKGFDASVIIDDVRRDFGVTDIQTNVLERGLEYPHSVAESLPLFRDEREQLAVAVGDPR